MSCPIDHLGSRGQNTSEQQRTECPVQHGKFELLNPSTQMPFEEDLNEGRDNTFLSKERITSSIPRSSEEPSRSHPMNNHENEPKNNHFWMYPSTQMFYSALKRKGYETDPKDVDSMVAVHNSLNEQVWQEILLWEKPNMGICPHPTLKRFRGRPQDLSPMALWNMYIKGADRPFDRHDWTVDRCGQDIRYIIDYYEGFSDADGFPTMNVQVRPALDSWESFLNRMKRRQ